MSRSLTSIVTLPAKMQRYDTAGDWIDNELYNGDLIDGYSTQISITAQKDWRYEACVAIHELAEMYICRHMGVTTEMVDEWDEQHTELEEPGDDKMCPYREAHEVASEIEAMLVGALGLTWKEYDAVIRGKEKA